MHIRFLFNQLGRSLLGIPLMLIILFGSIANIAWADDESTSLYGVNVLSSGQDMFPDDQISSPDGKYKLIFQTDGNLVVYNNANFPTWASNTKDQNGAKAVMQGDGNLVIYTPNRVPIWASNTMGKLGDYYLTLSNNGTLAIHGDHGLPAWQGAVRYNALRFRARDLRNGAGQPMCMDVFGANTGNGTNVQLWTCNSFDDGDAQSFIYNTADHTIRLRKDTNKCLDLSGNNHADGTHIQLYDCNGTDAQRFTYDEPSATIKLLANPAKCIDIDSSGTRDGTKIHLWSCNGTAAQKFDMVVSGGNAIPRWISSTSFKKRANYAKCMDLDSANTNNGTKIQLWDCNGSIQQSFLYNKVDGTLRMAKAVNKCIDVSYGQTNNGTYVQIWDCNGGENQRFDVDFLSGQIRFRRAPDKCLDIDSNSNNNGTKIHLWDCNNSDAQKFDIDGQIQNFSAGFIDVDDDVSLYVNGTRRFYSNKKIAGVIAIDPEWLNYGDNEIKILLGNYGCFASSLSAFIHRNGQVLPVIDRRYYTSSSHCGWQADWRYRINTVTGRIRQLQ